ncbi:hypothetical protein EG799_07590 [Aurantiacibacter spongiae]|uniref:PAS domain-containing protein n=2 Tax=Aurantiacibacter spongiae TaxID=2488860 RepID=A0A3N5DD15_9SPHN|nr:hypothetical protein EG799_07590 [Aurantiacibacter spongiae]
MDQMRGTFGAFDTDEIDVVEDEPAHSSADDAPPPAIGQDERRMQVRAYNFWAGLLDERSFPSIEDLDPDLLPDFGPHSVLLDFSHGIEDPRIGYLGPKLAAECDAAEMDIDRLSDVPSRSLLSRITDHYMQILANQAPIGFEAEFVNQRGATILYRGILLPFSSDDETIDFIFGVINWKEMADSHSADELLLEIDQALDSPLAVSRRAADGLTDWADGPGTPAAVDSEPVPHKDLPAPTFGLSHVERPADDEDVLDLDEVAFPQAPDNADMALGDWLAVAREMARAARASEDRTRAALYEAVSRAHDFALAAAREPADFAALLEDAGIAMQDRAPMTPVVKLVFGADYDKTRLTEYAAVLSLAQREGIPQGALAGYLGNAEGGLKGVVAAERAHRRAASGVPQDERPRGPRLAIARKLRALAPQDFTALSDRGEEFALVMIRRTEAGEVVVLGEVPGNTPLIEKAARELIG